MCFSSGDDAKQDIPRKIHLAREEKTYLYLMPNHFMLECIHGKKRQRESKSI